MSNYSINRIRFSSNDHDEFAEMLTVANVEEKILEPGGFKGSVEIIKSEHIEINRFEINRTVLQNGIGKKGYITFTIFEPNTLFHWRKYEMKNGMVGVLWNNEHQSITGSDFKGLPISIEEKFFQQTCQKKGYPEIIELVRNAELLQLNQTFLDKIRNLIKFINKNNSLTDFQEYNLIEHTLVHQFIDCLNESYAEKIKDDFNLNKFNNVVDYIHDNLPTINTVYQICRDNEVTERSLRRWFHKKYGISPKKYLTALRLNGVRKVLKNESNYTTIMEAASEYDFWHMSQFSKDYKNFFGELPSMTSSLK